MSQHDNPPEEIPSPYKTPAHAELVTADIVESKPRIWTALVVPIVGIVASLVVSTVVFVAAMFLIAGPPDPNQIEETLEKIFDHPLGIWALVLPGQLTFLAAAILAAILSPIPLGKRLRLGKGRLPAWTWLLFLIATPTIGIATGYLIEALGIEPSEHLQMLEDIITAQTGLAAFITALLVGLLPGFCEEILFRGYVQGRLLKRWSPMAAILLSSLLFAVAHIDPLHVCAVFPTGIWLGVIAYRADSIWPTILCHFANNFLAVIVSNLSAEADGTGQVELMLLVPCCIAMLVSLFVLASDRFMNRDEVVS